MGSSFGGSRVSEYVPYNVLVTGQSTPGHTCNQVRRWVTKSIWSSICPRHFTRPLLNYSFALALRLQLCHVQNTWFCLFMYVPPPGCPERFAPPRPFLSRTDDNHHGVQLKAEQLKAEQHVPVVATSQHENAWLGSQEEAAKANHGGRSDSGAISPARLSPLRILTTDIAERDRHRAMPYRAQDRFYG